MAGFDAVEGAVDCFTEYELLSVKMQGSSKWPGIHFDNRSSVGGLYEGYDQPINTIDLKYYLIHSEDCKSVASLDKDKIEFVDGSRSRDPEIATCRQPKKLPTGSSRGGSPRRFTDCTAFMWRK